MEKMENPLMFVNATIDSFSWKEKTDRERGVYHLKSFVIVGLCHTLQLWQMDKGYTWGVKVRT